MQSLGKKMLSKYTLYLICFLALNLIEFLRATQPGNIWSAAANCTGPVMMVIIFSQLPIRDFLKPANYVYTAICALAVGAVYFHWTGHMGEYYFGQMATAVINIWWLGLVIRWFFRKIIEEKAMKLQVGALGWVWLILTLWTLVSVAGRWWPVWYLLMFGAFYMIRFGKEDKAALIRAMIDGTIASFFAVQGYAYLFRPYDEVRYKGAFANCNMMALYYLIVYCMILFKLHQLHVRKSKLVWKVFYMALAGGLLAFQFLTVCRTAWVCSVAVTLCYGWVVLHRAWGDGLGKLAVRGCALVLSAVLTFPAVFLSVRWLPTIHLHPIWYEGEWNEDRVHSWDPADSEKYVELDEFLNEALGRIYNVLDLFHAVNPFVLRVYAASEADIIPEPDYDWTQSSVLIRKVILQTYWERSTWYGHPKEDGHYIFEESGIYIWHGQNLWIQITYYFGYPAGLLLVLLTVLALWKAGKKAGSVRRDGYAMIPFLICIVYFLFGFTEVVWNPGQLILALVFIVMHPQLTGDAEEISGQGPEKIITGSRNEKLE